MTSQSGAAVSRPVGYIPPISCNEFLYRIYMGERYFAYVELDGLDLSGIDLSGLHLARAKLREARLCDTNFSGSYLSEVRFRDSDLAGANFHGAFLSKARFSGAGLAGVDFTDADMSDSFLSGVDLRFSNFRRTSFRNARLRGALLAGADLSGCCLREAKFNRADLRGARLDEADARGASFVGAYLRDVHAIRANLSLAEFTGADLTGVCLDGAVLDGAGMRKCRLVNADLANASALETVFESADLSGATLKVVNLTGAKIVSTTMEGADLTSAELGKTTIRDVDLSAVIFADDQGNSAISNHAKFEDVTWPSHHSGKGRPSLLEVVSIDGLENAVISDTQAFTTYLEEAHQYLHAGSVAEADRFPRFVDAVVSKMKILRNLLAVEDDPPSILVETVSVVTDELLRYIKGHPRALYDIRPRQFEELVCEILSGYGWEVNLTPRSRDGGYDIFAISQDLSGLRTSWIVECKRYRETNKVGVEIARALYGVKTDLRVANAMLATTSSFTRGAKEFAASRWDFALRDYEGILEWINEYQPNPSGRLSVKNNRVVVN